MPTVTTPFGELHGIATGSGMAFLGVPYAEPPVGPLRFRRPVPRRRAPGPVDARHAAAAPLQVSGAPSPLFGDIAPRAVAEDCLHLNVWTPAADDGRRPVLVHLFGGGFQGGSASDGFQDAAALSRRGDCVVVRIGFRVGVLGFLHLGDVWGAPFEAGNVGLLDAVAALEWVAENIAALGGDPNNVTVFGLSSGAFMAAALFAVPAARPLFRRAFLQSGSASRVIDRGAAAARARAFLAEAGVGIGDLSALESLSGAAVLAAQTRILAADLGDRNAPGGRALGIVEDGLTVVDHPSAVLGSGVCRDKALVLGTTRDEARYWFGLGVMAVPSTPADLASEIDRFFPGHGGRLASAYIDADADADGTLAGARERFLTDAVYRLPAVATAGTHAAAGGAAYLFRFDWTPSGDRARHGASHGFDEPFVWGCTEPEAVPLLASSDSAAGVAGEMNEALLSFARTGAPGWAPIIADRPPVSRLFGNAVASSGAVDEALRHRFTGLERR